MLLRFIVMKISGIFHNWQLPFGFLFSHGNSLQQHTQRLIFVDLTTMNNEQSKYWTHSIAFRNTKNCQQYRTFDAERCGIFHFEAKFIIPSLVY